MAPQQAMRVMMAPESHSVKQDLIEALRQHAADMQRLGLAATKHRDAANGTRDRQELEAARIIAGVEEQRALKIIQAIVNALGGTTRTLN